MLRQERVTGDTVVNLTSTDIVEKNILAPWNYFIDFFFFADFGYEPIVLTDKKLLYTSHNWEPE